MAGAEVLSVQWDFVDEAAPLFADRPLPDVLTLCEYSPPEILRQSAQWQRAYHQVSHSSRRYCSGYRMSLHRSQTRGQVHAEHIVDADGDITYRHGWFTTVLNLHISAEA